jgi:Flp pilus assembly protein TadD
MSKRRLVVAAIVIALTVVFLPLRPAQGIFLSEQELAAIDGINNPSIAYEGQNQSGSAFVRVLKAPFKAIGKLFGRGKNDNKLQRLSEKDVKHFESAQVTRVNDASTAPAPAPPNRDMTAPEHLERGRSLLNEGNLNEAIEELSLATSMDPRLADAHNLLGVAYERKGLSEMARKSFETALKIDKKNVQTLNNLGYLLYRNGDYRGAIDRLKKAAHLAPQDERILNNLALAQSRLGKFDDAYKNFARAGGEINGRLNVANRLELAGRPADAQKQYEAARLKTEAEQKANPNSQAITVMMEVKNGRVTYASVANHRAGMEAYEAAALRIARERHYPTTKNGPETIVVRVTPLPAS